MRDVGKVVGSVEGNKLGFFVAPSLLDIYIFLSVMSSEWSILFAVVLTWCCCQVFLFFCSFLVAFGSLLITCPSSFSFSSEFSEVKMRLQHLVGAVIRERRSLIWSLIGSCWRFLIIWVWSYGDGFWNVCRSCCMITVHVFSLSSRDKIEMPCEGI